MKLIAGALVASALTIAGTADHVLAQQPGEPPSAQQQVCLQNNRIWSWNAVNDRLLIVTDVQLNRFIVRLNGGCIGLSTYGLNSLSFYSWSDLGCLGHCDQ